MGKFATNPDVMSKDIGVTPAASPSLKQPKTTGYPTMQAPTAQSGTIDAMLPNTGAAAPPGTVPAGCVPAGPSRFVNRIEAKKQGKVVWTDPATGQQYLCPPTNPADENVAGEGLGEYAWPPELMDMYQNLVSRGGEYLGAPGYSDQALAYMFGTDFEKLRGQEAATRQQILDQQSRQGMLGSGSGIQQLIDNAWGTEGKIANTMRDLFVANEGQKRADVAQGAGLFGSATEFNKALETINAARRGEGTQMMQLMLALLQILKGGG